MPLQNDGIRKMLERFDSSLAHDTKFKNGPMKPQQRSFVVEYKSARRRSPQQANAIWGKVDLKTILREAEVDAPYLFVEAVTSGPVQSTGLRSSCTDPVNTHLTSVDTGASIDAPVCQAFSDDNETFTVRETDLEQVTVTQPPVKNHDGPRGTAKRVARPNRASRAGIIAVAEPVDELDRLENENRQLKATLIERLREENWQLRNMLGRF